MDNKSKIKFLEKNKTERESFDNENIVGLDNYNFSKFFNFSKNTLPLILLYHGGFTRIDEIFPSRSKKGGISLSTVHKAKGLEADNVYIICESLMPSQSAKKEWEIKQEYNLMYVAYTRAKNKLGFVDESDFDGFDFTSPNNIGILKRIETQVNKVLNKSTRIILTDENIKKIINNAVIINKDVISSNKCVNINSINRRNVNTFANMLKQRMRK